MVPTGRSHRLKAILVLSLLLFITQLTHASASWLFEGLVRTLNTGGSITLNSRSAMVVDPAVDVFVADTDKYGFGDTEFPEGRCAHIIKVAAAGAVSLLTAIGITFSRTEGVTASIEYAPSAHNNGCCFYG